MKFTFTPKLILDFDIENRPLSYRGDKVPPTAEITAIAASFNLDESMWCWLLGAHSPETMLAGFVGLYDQADIVTGHYIRMHDLPIINGALLEYGMPALKPKMTIDTKLDLKPIKDFSCSQESLGQVLGTAQDKVHMTQQDWRQANRLIDIEAAERRVTADVRQHQEMRLKLVELNMLEPPKIWSPRKSK